MVTPASASKLALVPLAVAAILVITAVAVSLPTVFGLEAVGDAFTRSTLPFMLFGVATASIVTTRVLVLPQIFRRFRDGTSETEQTLQQVSTAARIVAFPFAVSAAVYGLVVVVFSGLWWLVLPFSALALVMLVITSTYIEREIRELEVESRIRGDA